MRRSFFLGTLPLFLSGSAMVPALAEASWATSLLNESHTEEPSTELAIRQIDGTAPVEDPTQPVLPLPIAPLPNPEPRVVKVSHGEASWYGPGFYGRRTANGERFTKGTMTAAHRHLPFGTKVRVTNLRNGRAAVVRINDRGPFHGNRVIDLAHGAASALGVTSSGLAQVKLEVLQKP
jgi:rare lipoprotein A